MTLNKDGLEPGKPVDFTTLMRVKRAPKAQNEAESETTKPKRTKAKEKQPEATDDEET